MFAPPAGAGKGEEPPAACQTCKPVINPDPGHHSAVCQAASISQVSPAPSSQSDTSFHSIVKVKAFHLDSAGDGVGLRVGRGGGAAGVSVETAEEDSQMWRLLSTVENYW